jgi:hypothetical protein
MRSKSNQTGMHSAASVSPDEFTPAQFNPAYLDETLPQAGPRAGQAVRSLLPVHREIFFPADKGSQG